MRILIFGLSLLSLAGHLDAAAAQSFNCGRAFFADERAICHSPELAQLDSQLAAVFGRAMSAIPQDERAALKRQEDQWVVSRRRCGRDDGCIEKSYRDRMGSLGGQIAAKEPQGSFAGSARKPQPQGSTDEAPRDAAREGVTVQFR